MGITIFYKGTLGDLDRIEDLEDRVLDLALDLGANAQIFRSTSDIDPQRTVRGLIVDLAPGQETTSLLFSPEGWLINLLDINDAESGCLQEAPSCFVKTQFSSVEGHVALIELLDALRKEFIPDLQVNDEGGYWEGRDVVVLRDNFMRLQRAIEGMKDGLEQYGLSSEAAEDSDILVSRIERIARQVQRTIARPAEHPPARFDDFDNNDPLLDEDRLGTEEEWDGSFKENRRNQERLGRAIEERLQSGEDHEEAFENALRDEGFGSFTDDPSLMDENDELEAEFFEAEPDEPWKESLPEAIRDDHDDIEDDIADERHPLQESAMEFMLRLHEVAMQHERSHSGHLDVLHRGAGDIIGGLAQALSAHGEDVMYGLSVVQLKRALRGAAFARGALYPLRTEGVIDEELYGELLARLENLRTDMLAELKRLRTQWKQAE